MKVFVVKSVASSLLTKTMTIGATSNVRSRASVGPVGSVGDIEASNMNYSKGFGYVERNTSSLITTRQRKVFFLLLAFMAMFFVFLERTSASISPNVGGNMVESVNESIAHEPFRVMLIVTTSNEHDDGSRGTTSGANRMYGKLLPTMASTITSLSEDGGRAGGRRWIGEAKRRQRA